jgi:hypothetical protein
MAMKSSVNLGFQIPYSRFQIANSRLKLSAASFSDLRKYVVIVRRFGRSLRSDNIEMPLTAKA